MVRTSYALMSLVAAVPAFILAAALTLAFLSHADEMFGLLPVVAGLAWLIAVLVAVTPVGILLFGGPRSARAAKSPEAAPAAADATDEELIESEIDDESFISEEGFSDEFVEASDDDWNEGDSAADFAQSEEDEFVFDEDASSEFDADFDFDDDEKR